MVLGLSAVPYGHGKWWAFTKSLIATHATGWQSFLSRNVPHSVTLVFRHSHYLLLLTKCSFSKVSCVGKIKPYLHIVEETDLMSPRLGRVQSVSGEIRMWRCISDSVWIFLHTASCWRWYSSQIYNRTDYSGSWVPGQQGGRDPSQSPAGTHWSSVLGRPPAAKGNSRNHTQSHRPHGWRRNRDLLALLWVWHDNLPPL